MIFRPISQLSVWINLQQTHFIPAKILSLLTCDKLAITLHMSYWLKGFLMAGMEEKRENE